MMAPNTQIRQMTHVIQCTRTGVPLGKLDLTLTAGHMPYLSHWHEMVAYHPLFSLTPYKLIDFMRNEWNRLAKDVVNEQASEAEEKLLCVGFVALLHNLGAIQQDRDCIGLPSIATVQSNLESLLQLSTWKNYLDSKRFAFPLLHISKLNNNGALEYIHDYLDACWDCKRAWEAGLDDELEKEHARIAERAVLAIRGSMYKPVSKKLLWTWIKSQLPSKFKGDAWLGEIFLGANSNVTNWDWDELELFEEIIQSCLPTSASVINFAVRERINEIKKVWKDHYDTFTIEETGEQFIETLNEELSGTPEPKPEDFKLKSQYYVAKAKWDLAHRSTYQKPVNPIIEAARNKLEDNGL